MELTQARPRRPSAGVRSGEREEARQAKNAPEAKRILWRETTKVRENLASRAIERWPLVHANISLMFIVKTTRVRVQHC